MPIWDTHPNTQVEELGMRKLKTYYIFEKETRKRELKTYHIGKKETGMRELKVLQ